MEFNLSKGFRLVALILQSILLFFPCVFARFPFFTCAFDVKSLLFSIISHCCGIFDFLSLPQHSFHGAMPNVPFGVSVA
jgi:hypothetical protein